VTSVKPLFRRQEQPQQPDQYSFEDYFMVGIYIRRATAVPVLNNCSPKKLHRGPERPEQYLVTPDISPLRQFAPLDVFNVSSMFPAYSVKTQASISARCTHWRGAMFRDTRLVEGHFLPDEDGKMAETICAVLRGSLSVFLLLIQCKIGERLQ